MPSARRALDAGDGPARDAGLPKHRALHAVLSGALGRHRDLSHEVRKLSGFRRRYRTDVLALAGRLGLAGEIDGVRLTRLFLDWHEDFSGQRPCAHIDRRDFIVFCAGLMLAHLLAAEPLRLRPPAENRSDRTAPADPRLAFWPEGLVQTSYCLALLEAVLAQEGEAPLRLDPCFEELRTWWSFRENVREDPLRAIGFLDRFVGAEPNWTMPGAAIARPAMRRAPPPLARPN